jgi:uncharacterized protein YndB with AHSA1/START domain
MCVERQPGPIHWSIQFLMRSITESIDVPCTPERLFQTLHTPSEICMWWSARSAIVLPRPGGFWAATWGKDEDQPDYIAFARLTDFEPPRRMVMANYEYSAAGQPPLPFADDLSTTFLVEPAGEFARLTVTQVGFPDGEVADAFYQGCCQGWKATLAAIKDFF